MKSKIKYSVLLLPVIGGVHTACSVVEEPKPNILFVIADDWSYPHASAYGTDMVVTYGFDMIASQGALFSNAYVTSPGSSPSRASLLTGMYPWQIEEAGTHASSFPSKFECYPDRLAKAGYHIGFTGKGWAPGDWEVSGRKYNPAGPEYNNHRLIPPYTGISKIDYTENFKEFLSEKDSNQPFCFWIGTLEPHRPYEVDSWKNENDKSLIKALRPEFLPDSDVIRGDLLDYAVEVEWFDSHLVKCIEELKRIGEFENTIIIVTADNGMAFPSAKANCYDVGIHVPLAICWGNKIKSGQVIDALVSSVDFAPTIMDVAGVEQSDSYVGESLLPLLTGVRQASDNDVVFAGRERHTNARHNNLGYPIRSMRWKNYLLIRNFHPKRWPAGDPQEIDMNGKVKPMHHAYFDIDAAPSKTYIIENYDNPDVSKYFLSATAKRPEYELFDLRNDIACMNNVADEASYSDILADMKTMLNNKLEETNDNRVCGDNAEVWESYPRLVGKMRKFPKID